MTLEATLSGRRFRIVRSPAWERPKKRGAGTTTQQSAVTISELVDQAWRPLSSRIDETGDLVTHLVGMNLPQFTQVAMLPQGRFQAFLRARSDDRHRLLQQLFRTGRFEDVERWLRERRLALSVENGREHERVADLVSRLSEVTDVALPADWDLHDLSIVAVSALPGWADERGVACAVAVCETSRLAVAASHHEASARASLDEAREVAALRARHDAAVAEESQLLASTESHLADQTRLDAARRAAAVAPLHRFAVTASSSAAEAREVAGEALDHLARRLDTDVTSADLETLIEQSRQAATAARAALPKAARLRDLVTECEEIDARLVEVERAGAVDAQRCTALPVEVTALRASVREAESASVRLATVRDALVQVRSQVEAARESVSLGSALADARQEWLDVRAATLDLKEELVTLQHARIDGMAAELAGALVVGGCCPVCGSADHPHKAATAPGAPDAEAERVARAAVDDAAVVEHAHDTKVRDLENRLAVLSARAGNESLAVLVARAAELQADADSCAASSARANDLAVQLTQAEDELVELEAAIVRRVGEQALLEGRRTSLIGELERLRAELGDLAEIDLERAAGAHEQTARIVAEARAAHDRADAAKARCDDARRAMIEAAADAGFASAHEAVAAALDREVLSDLAERISAHERRLAAVREVLASPEVAHAASLPQLDVEALAAQHTLALAAHTAAGAARELAITRQRRATGLVTELEAGLASWAPVRDELALTTDLAAFVEGKSSDNSLRMRLSAYVLAYRLTQVVAAANERLARMSDQRYSLEHTGRRGAGETRGGLSLLVRDDWSGESRDPATLSGGETFVVSLALALGLADVITQETGGAALDTLFVDEGFGSLDADTLDDVMDTLDSLRDGGRVVGVVSHVAEMRDRIPTQLVVTKSRAGSTLSVRRYGRSLRRRSGCASGSVLRAPPAARC